MKRENSEKKAYHHGNLAESLLNAVDQLATQFGFEAVTLRGCAKLVGVSPSSAFRHYADKRALMTAFATRALTQLSDAMALAKTGTNNNDTSNSNISGFHAVGLAYVTFALEKPAFFRAMWREEAIYTNDEHYVAAANGLGAHLQGGFADTIDDTDPTCLSAQELLAWSSVHGLASLFVDGPVSKGLAKSEKIKQASEMIDTLVPAFSGTSE